MPEVTLEGQKRLKQARVLCIGAGGLGSPALFYLTAAGVGTIGLIDFDKVDLSNLQRQILHRTSDVGRKKTDSARERLRETNPNVELEVHDAQFTSDNAQELVSRYDLVVDGSDNFATRYLSNDVCVWAKKPNIYGSVFRFDGNSSVFAPHLGGPCYRCLFPEPPEPGTVPSCAEAGVLGVVPGIVGMIQAIEAIKLILQKGDSLVGRLLSFDALQMKFREFKIRRDPSCPVCGDNPTIFEPIDYEGFCNATTATTTPIRSISVIELQQKLTARRRIASAGCPGTLRIRDREHRWLAIDSAWAARRNAWVSFKERKRWLSCARAECAAPTRLSSCSEMVSRKRSTSRAESTPGRIRSIRQCKSIN